MGGCCCCASKGAEISRREAYYYCPRASEERVPLSPHHGAASGLSTGLFVDTNLDTSIPDTYRSPPTPMPYDVTLWHPQTPPGVQIINSESIQEASAKCEEFKESNKKLQADVELESAKESKLELSKSITAADEEDLCPTCLEEYELENPKIVTKCDHHFHLSCILEWLERSDTCPVCDQEMIFSPPID